MVFSVHNIYHYTYVYIIYIYIHIVCVRMSVYIYIERERETERDGERQRERQKETERDRERQREREREKETERDRERQREREDACELYSGQIRNTRFAQSLKKPCLWHPKEVDLCFYISLAISCDLKFKPRKYTRPILAASATFDASHSHRNHDSSQKFIDT